MRKLSLILGFSILMASSIYARECNDYERDKAEHFAEQAGPQIVDKLGAGVDIYTKLTDCKYSSYDYKYRLNIEVQFNGAIIHSHHYEVDGILVLNSDGSKVSFTKTWANARLRNWMYWKNIVIGTIILSNIANKSNSSY